MLGRFRRVQIFLLTRIVRVRVRVRVRHVEGTDSINSINIIIRDTFAGFEQDQYCSYREVRAIIA